MNQVQRAKQYAKSAILFSVVVTLATLLIMGIFSDFISRIFTDDKDIIAGTKESLWSLFLYIFFSTIKGVQNGVIRALGLQKKNTFITLVFAYGLGIPLGYMGCFTIGMKLVGLWLGIAIANGVLIFAIHVCLIS